MFVSSILNQTTGLASHSVHEAPLQIKAITFYCKTQTADIQKNNSTKEIQTVRKQEEGHSQTITN